MTRVLRTRLRVQQVALGLGLFVGLAAAAQAQLPQIDFSIAPYKHNMLHGQACSGPGVTGYGCVYSGNFVVHTQAWGVYVVDTTRPTWQVAGGMVSPVESQKPNYQPAALTKCSGDFIQSAQYVAASPLSPKWVVTTINGFGSIGACTPVGNPFRVQVYSLDNSNGLKYQGQANVNSWGSNSLIVGDKAYIDLGTGSWTKIDLPSCSGAQKPCTIEGNVSSLPAHTPQDTIGGFTYSFVANTEQTFSAIRGGAPIDAPPAASASMTNLSANARLGAEKTKNYLGDKWQIQDTSVAQPAADSIKWDIRLPNGTAANFAADSAWQGALPNSALSNIASA